jgi:hypothetical protein
MAIQLPRAAGDRAMLPKRKNPAAFGSGRTSKDAFTHFLKNEGKGFPSLGEYRLRQIEPPAGYKSSYSRLQARLQVQVIEVTGVTGVAGQNRSFGKRVRAETAFSALFPGMLSFCPMAHFFRILRRLKRLS